MLVLDCHFCIDFNFRKEPATNLLLKPDTSNYIYISPQESLFKSITARKDSHSSFFWETMTLWSRAGLSSLAISMHPFHFYICKPISSHNQTNPASSKLKQPCSFIIKFLSKPCFLSRSSVLKTYLQLRRPCSQPMPPSPHSCSWFVPWSSKFFPIGSGHTLSENSWTTSSLLRAPTTWL